MSTAALAAQLRALASGGALNLPLPGAGRTAERHWTLLKFGRSNLSLARLAEAHVDALAILSEAGHPPAGADLYGVWASEGPAGRLELQRLSDGQLVLNGVKNYCTGAGLLDRSLVTVHDGEHRMLVDVSLRSEGLLVDDSKWATPAFAATSTASVQFNEVVIEPDCLIGGPNWYLERPGFWHGALGPAACWAGGAIGLIDAARRMKRTEPHFRAHLGALEASAWALRAFLDQAAAEIDTDPEDDHQCARSRALIARHLIERTCTEVLDRFGRATGPALLAFDALIAQRYSELTLYIRQCHAERDLAQIDPTTITSTAAEPTRC